MGYRIRLEDALRRVLECKECKGKGTIWVRGAPDKRCQCRADAYRLLREIDGKGSTM